LQSEPMRNNKQLYHKIFNFYIEIYGLWHCRRGSLL
jgi:hypothetical protein